MSDITFGPVPSRRFGMSLGVDLSGAIKQCNFDCLYCELSPAPTMTQMYHVLSVDDIINAIGRSLKEHPNIDVITLTANGEPTLYPHLKTLISQINHIKKTTKMTLIMTMIAIVK